LNTFDELELVSLSGVIDGTFVTDPGVDELASQQYACGLFEFQKSPE